MTHTYDLFDNGVRLIVDEMPDVNSISVAVGVGIGGRHETEELSGISHFVEHMAFKGTATKNFQDIAEEFDDVGAAHNAYTCKESTFFYYKSLAEHGSKCIDLLLDMVFHSTYPESEILREKGVILEEKNESDDDPEDRASELYMELSYKDQQMGRSILGNRENIENMTRENLLKFVHDYYVGQNIVVSLAGNVTRDQAYEWVHKGLIKIPSGPKVQHEPTHYVGGCIHETRDLEQLQIYLGFPSVGLLDSDYYAYKLAAIILGGGMASRLFQEAREKRGLAYSVHSHSSSYDGCGTFTVYASASPANARELIKVSIGQIADMIHNVSELELNRAKTKIKASVLLGREDSMSRVLWAANSYLSYDRYVESEEIRHKVDAVTLDDIKVVARNLLSGKKNTLTLLGKVENSIDYEELQAIIAASI